MITLTVGIPGSGKSTWAKKQDAVEVNRDMIRKSLFCNGDTDAMFEYRFTSDKEGIVTATSIAAVSSAVSVGRDVIVSDTNLVASTRDRYKLLAKNLGVDYKEVVFPDIDKAFKRNLQRSTPVPMQVMLNMYRLFRQYEGRTPYTPGADPCIICDLDGTLYDMNGRSPYADDVSGDLVNEVILDLLRRSGYPVVLMSGRKESARASTEAKLRADGVEYECLIMRATSDNRPDYLVKEDLFDTHLSNKDVRFILDDRAQVVNMWRAKGLTCFQVADGYF